MVSETDSRPHGRAVALPRQPVAAPANRGPQSPYERCSSNSRSTNTICTRWSLGDHGVDTVVFGWKDPEATRVLLDFFRRKPRDPDTGYLLHAVWGDRVVRLRRAVEGIRFGLVLSSGVVTAEARLSAMLTGRVDDASLANPERVLEGAQRARTVLGRLGVGVSAPAHVRRIDPAAELTFPVATDGLAYLGACHRGLQLPRLRQVAFRAPGQPRVECIAWETPMGRRTRLRLYDAGARHETHNPGHRLRLEREQRWQGARTPLPESITPASLAALFRALLKPWVSTQAVVEVSTPDRIVERLYRDVRHGRMHLRKAESLSGKVATVVHGDDLLPPHGRRRRMRELRSAGIALDRSEDGHAYIDLAPPLAALIGVWNEASATPSAADWRRQP